MSSASLSDQFPSGNSYIPSNGPIYNEIDSTSSVGLLDQNNTPRNSIPSVDFQGRKSSSRVLLILTVVSLAFSVVCLVALGLCCCWFFVLNDGELFPQTSGLKGEEKKMEVCVPCLQISPNPLETAPSSLWRELDVRYDEENATEICCATSSAQFAVLFKLILQRQQAVKKLADSMDQTEARKKKENDVMKEGVSQKPAAETVGSAVSAHLVFKPRRVYRSGSRPTKESLEQQWKSPSESHMSHVREGLSFKNERIVVTSPGRYYIYCQFLYSPSHLSSSDDSRDVVSAYVRRYSILRPAAPNFLLKMRHTRQDVTNDRHSSYAGGVFYLHRGDSLYVQVSHPHLISHDEVGSFFGLFKIGE